MFGKLGWNRKIRVQPQELAFDSKICVPVEVNFKYSTTALLCKI